MTPNEERILELGQKIYRAMNKTANQNIVGEDLQIFLDDTIDWVNQFLDELETETYEDGSPVYWNFSRFNGDVVGVATESAVYGLPDTIRTLVINPYTDLQIKQDGTTVSSFKLVDANQVATVDGHDLRDRATVLGRNLVLSRELTPEEQGGELVADTISYIPRLSREDVSMLDTVEPLQLVVLGTAKNWILPDKVSGELSPSFAQKYADLLTQAKRINAFSSESSIFPRESLSYIGGIW